LRDAVRVTVIATGFDRDREPARGNGIDPGAKKRGPLSVWNGGGTNGATADGERRGFMRRMWRRPAAQG
jgi:hypothetical protein